MQPRTPLAKLCTCVLWTWLCQAEESRGAQKCPLGLKLPWVLLPWFSCSPSPACMSACVHFDVWVSAFCTGEQDSLPARRTQCNSSKKQSNSLYITLAQKSEKTEMYRWENLRDGYKPSLHWSKWLFAKKNTTWSNSMLPFYRSLLSHYSPCQCVLRKAEGMKSSQSRIPIESGKKPRRGMRNKSYASMQSY